MQHSPRLSLKVIRSFVSVVECRSISVAARELNIATSAVSAAIDQIEAEFGVQLLVRARARGVFPTETALTLAAQFRNLLEDYARILDRGKTNAEGVSGSLRIGYYAPVAPAFLPQLAVPLIKSNPDLQVAFFERDNESAQEDLLAGRLDIILFTGHDLRSGIDTLPLMDLPPYVLMPAEHPLSSCERLSMNDVAQYPLVQLDLPVARPYLRGLFAAADLEPVWGARANSTEMVRSLVGAGAGLAILNMKPKTAVTYGGDKLTAVPLASDLPSITLQAGYLKKRPRMVVKKTLEMLLDWSDSADANAVRAVWNPQKPPI
jgi:DNA-binding transcriptional LysR family regulator